MTDTTSFNDLPVDPAGGGNNIALSVQENTSNNVINSSQSLSLDQSTISQIVNGLQQASSSGATKLPSRDIPQQTSNLVQDPYIQPNYVPTLAQKSNYINDYENTDDIISKYNRSHNNKNKLDDFYNEIQGPLLITIIYFIFQLPIFRKTLFNYIPILFSNDGNYNLNGYLFNSCLFGIIFFGLNKVIFQ
jgi:hypothetical protein